MSDELKVQVTLTAPTRVSWPNVLTSRAKEIPGVPPGEPIFDARFVFPADHPDLATLKKAAGGLLRALNPTADFKVLRPVVYVNRIPQGDFGYPFKTGTQMIKEAKERSAKKNKEYGGWEDYMAGCDTLYAKSAAKFPPQVDVLLKDTWVKLSADNRAVHKDRFYNGMRAYGAVTLSGYRSAGGWGVTCYLNGLAAIDGGERIGQQAITYPSMTGSVSGLNPFADEIPFYASTKPAHLMNNDEIPF